jgi:hypothetical protein
MILAAYNRTAYENAKQAAIDDCEIVISDRGNEGSGEIGGSKGTMVIELLIRGYATTPQAGTVD